MSIFKKLFGSEEKEVKRGQYGVDYQGASDIIDLNKNLLRALEHEKAGISFYRRFFEQADDSRCKEMYKVLIEEEERHLKMVLSQIERRKQEGTWTED